MPEPGEDGRERRGRDDFFRDPRVLEAEVRHAERRRRTGLAYDVLDWAFYMALLVVMVLVFKVFLGLVLPFIS